MFGFEMDTFIGFSLLLLQQGSIMTFLAVPYFIQKCTKSFLSICTCSQYALYYTYYLKNVLMCTFTKKP